MSAKSALVKSFCTQHHVSTVNYVRLRDNFSRMLYLTLTYTCLEPSDIYTYNIITIINIHVVHQNYTYCIVYLMQQQE